jgi:hypothetical protein
MSSSLKNKAEAVKSGRLEQNLTERGPSNLNSGDSSSTLEKLKLIRGHLELQKRRPNIYEMLAEAKRDAAKFAPVDDEINNVLVNETIDLFSNIFSPMRINGHCLFLAEFGRKSRCSSGAKSRRRL